MVAMHGVDAGTYNSYIDMDKHGCLIEWIAAQHRRLEAVTLLEAVARRGCKGRKIDD